jgi:hypothetical protein
MQELRPARPCRGEWAAAELASPAARSSVVEQVSPSLGQRKERESPRLFAETADSHHTEPMQPANQRVLRGFLDYLKVEKGLAALSVQAYESDLEQFAEFLVTRRRDFAGARKEDVRAFLGQLFAN